MNGLALRPPSTYVSVCSGVGGLDLGLHAAIPGLEPVVYLEREAHAAAVLVARMEEAALLAAPVWDDVCAFDARPLVGLVDLVAGGTPCQNLSLAGKREGLDGDRSRLFYEHVRIARECEAPFLFWENVAGAVGAVPAVAAHLHSSGYDSIVWTVVRARDVGAPHERTRVFLLAHSEHWRERQRSRAEGRESGEWPPEREGFGSGGEGVHSGVGLANPDSHGREGQRGGRLLDGEWAALGHHPDGRGGAPANVGQAHACGPGLEEWRALRGDGAEERPAPVGGGLGVFPPGRSDRAAWTQVLAVRPDLAPATTQPRFRGLGDGLGVGVDVCVCPREDRLRAAGNGVVPQQATLAWRILWAALCERLIGGQRP